MAKGNKQPREKRRNRREPEVPLEAKGVEAILNGGSYVTRNGRVITMANVPRSYSEAVRSGLDFYIGKSEDEIP